MERPVNPIKIEPIDLTLIPDPPKGFARGRVPSVVLKRIQLPTEDIGPVNISSDDDYEDAKHLLRTFSLHFLLLI